MSLQRLFGPVMAALTLIFLAGCTEEAVVDTGPVVRPVKTMVISDFASGGLRNFPGRVAASKRADLSFRVPGKLQKLLVREGEFVNSGQVIAELAPTDYRIQLENAKAEYEQARADYERGKVLVEKGHISRRQFDTDESRFKQTRAALKQADLNLSYTVLKSPFSGVIARRSVENFEEIAAKQEIFALRDTRELEIRIDVPESIMRLVERGGAERAVITASFPLAGDTRYPLVIKEVSNRADANTQTFEVRFSMTSPESINVLSGMTANVLLDMTQLSNFRPVISLPESALDKREQQPTVWLFHQDDGSVSKRRIYAEASRTSRVRVSEGLGEGDRVIIAGVSHLDETITVYELDHVEQAEY